VAASKGKDTQDEREVSLIPAIEREEEQFRQELEQARREAESQVRRAEEEAEQYVLQSRQSIAELVEQTRKERLAQFRDRAGQLSRSLEQRRMHLQQQKTKNMAEAVQRAVDAVTAGGDKK